MKSMSRAGWSSDALTGASPTPVEGLSKTTAKSSDPYMSYNIKRPTMRKTSPTLVVMNAFLAAAAALSFQ